MTPAQMISRTLKSIIRIYGWQQPNGVIVLDRKTREMKKRFDIDNGLPHNSINKIFVSHEGNVYIGTRVTGYIVLIRILILSMGNHYVMGALSIRFSHFHKVPMELYGLQPRAMGFLEFLMILFLPLPDQMI